MLSPSFIRKIEEALQTPAAKALGPGVTEMTPYEAIGAIEANKGRTGPIKAPGIPVPGSKQGAERILTPDRRPAAPLGAQVQQDKRALATRSPFSSQWQPPTNPGVIAALKSAAPGYN